MTPTLYKLHGVQILEHPPDGQKLHNDRDAIEFIGDARHRGAELIVLPVERLDDDFFQLKTRLAGEIIQKFVTYGVRIAILGGISHYLAESAALRDFVYEANRGDHVWFVANAAELEMKLGRGGAV